MGIIYKIKTPLDQLDEVFDKAYALGYKFWLTEREGNKIRILRECKDLGYVWVYLNRVSKFGLTWCDLEVTTSRYRELDIKDFLKGKIKGLDKCKGVE